jgi:hypothetical protein
VTADETESIALRNSELVEIDAALATDRVGRL